jgi:hypothetical protein
MYGLLKTIGQIAGIGGIAVVVLLLIFRQILNKKIFPVLNKGHAYRLLNTITVCTFLIALAGIGAWVLSESINKATPSKSPQIPGGTGWIIAGKISIDSTGNNKLTNGALIWASGPHFQIIKTGYSDNHEIPKAGDIIQLKDSRPVYIINYATSGLLEFRTPPPNKGTLDSGDETGVSLPVGSTLDVRDVCGGYYPGADHAFLWLRVAYSQ